MHNFSVNASNNIYVPQNTLHAIFYISSNFDYTNTEIREIMHTIMQSNISTAT